MSKRISPFNSPLETGVRSLSILEAAHPRSCDLQRLVELDYLVVHSGDAGGPSTLHAPLPMRAGELLVRKQIIEKGILLMISRGLVERIANPGGVHYRASEEAGPFMSSLTASYSLDLRDRARWAIDTFGDMTTDAVRSVTQRFFDRWTSEFQPAQISGASS